MRLDSGELAELMSRHMQESVDRLALRLAEYNYGPPIHGPWPNPPPVPWYRRAWRWLVALRWRVCPYYLRNINDDEDDE